MVPVTTAALVPRHGRVQPQLFIFLFLILVAISGIFLWRSRMQEGVGELIVSGTVEGEDIALGSKIGGRISALHVREGDAVTEGSLLAELAVPELSAQREQLAALKAEASAQHAKLLAGPRSQELEQARARLATAEAQLSELQQGSRSEDIAAAEAAWRAAEVEYDLAATELRRAEELFNEGVIPRSQLDVAQARADRLRQAANAAQEEYNKAQSGPRETQISAAQANVDALRAAYELLAAGSRIEDIAAAGARVEQIAAQIALLDISIAEARVQAPAAGIIQTLNVQAGDIVAPGQAIYNIILPQSYFVQVFIPADKLSWAEPGAQASIAVDAYPAELFSGTVSFLATEGEFTPRNLQTKEKRVEQVFRCKVSINDASGRLRPGMACDLRFLPPGTN